MFDWAFGDNEDDLNEALLQESDGFESEITPCVITPPPVGLCCQKHHLGSTELHHSPTEIRATLLTNQIAVFEIGRL